MSAKDISRFLFQPQKRYSSVRMQQGRVITDADWNESERIDDEEARRTLLDIICSKGTPNQGFRVGGVERETVRIPGDPGDDDVSIDSVETYDFSLAPGSFYLGGLRFEVGPGAERFLDQSDWLQIDADPVNLPAPPSVADLTDANGNVRDRFDLVYLRGWEQCVTAVEDSELREVALGGPDTSTRIRRMRRIEVLADGGPSCAEAFGDLKTRLIAPLDGDQSNKPHGFDPASCELRSKAKLTVAPDDEGLTEDPCKPKVEAGFLGAENQTIRVELTATDRFIWGYDNASPYYRVQVQSEDGQALRIKFLTLPRDQQSQPLKGQAVELHPWGSLLPNREKVAELGGHLATVESSYDPESRTLTISDPVPQAWLDWLDHPDHEEYQSERDPDGQKKYLYLRLWTGGSGDAAAPDFSFDPGEPVKLEGTGLTVTFGANGLPGDHWIIAARPHTPDVVVAWELMDQAPPAGTRRFFAPLALIRWSVESDIDVGQTVRASVHDCRAKFRPLCEVRGCCTVTVGDGLASHGDFQEIQDAVDSLPAEGGEICLLPGIHEAGATILGRRNIKIHGCGKQTLVVPSRRDRRAPIFRIVDSACITLERMGMATLEGGAVVVGGSETAGSKEIEIGHNRILAFEQAVRVDGGAGFEIHHNRIRMLDKQGAGVGILLAAEDARIERNDIGVAPARRTPPEDDPGDRPDPDPEDPCEDPESVYGNLRFFLGYLSRVFRPLVAIFLPRPAPFRALGGIQLAAGAERVKVLDNRVHGGAGNGITLGGGGAVPVDGPDGGEEEHVFQGEAFSRFIVLKGGEPQAEVTLAFTDPDGVTTTVVSGSQHSVPISGPGEYRVLATSPTLEIERLEVRLNPLSLNGFPRVLVIHVRDVARLPDTSLAFLRRIRIAENAIEGMALSGIGIPHPTGPDVVEGIGVNRFSTNASRLARATVGRVGNPVLGLDIHRNEIGRCLQRAFDATLEAVARTQGLGGISLGITLDVSISENRIVENGRSHIDPVCGIFIGLGHWLTIRENAILENGPLGRGGSVEIKRGMRGGIVVRNVAAAQVARLDRTRRAAAIEHNEVSQPAGRALDVLAVGPVSVADNQLSTTIPEADAFGQSVSIAGFGDGQKLPPGNVLFQDNQVRHGSIQYNRSQFISTQGDLIYKGNHAHVEGPGFANVWLYASRTLMAVHNRFDERARATLSANTQGVVMNDTSDNQANHCIKATTLPPNGLLKDGPNQILDPTGCSARGVIITAVSNLFLARLYREES